MLDMQISLEGIRGWWKIWRMILSLIKFMQSHFSRSFPHTKFVAWNVIVYHLMYEPDNHHSIQTPA